MIFTGRIELLCHVIRIFVEKEMALMFLQSRLCGDIHNLYEKCYRPRYIMRYRYWGLTHEYIAAKGTILFRVTQMLFMRKHLLLRTAGSFRSEYLHQGQRGDQRQSSVQLLLHRDNAARCYSKSVAVTGDISMMTRAIRYHHQPQ